MMFGGVFGHLGTAVALIRAVRLKEAVGEGKGLRSCGLLKYGAVG